MEMSRTERKKTQGTRCSNCRKFVPGYDIINLGSIESGYAPCGGAVRSGTSYSCVWARRKPKPAGHSDT
jgi:hypothetical protein